MRGSRSTWPSLLAGIVLGTALSLTLTTWAVRARWWPGQAQPVQIAATPPMAPQCPAPSPPPPQAQAPSTPPAVQATASDLSSLASSDASATGARAGHDKAKKKKKAKSSPAMVVAHTSVAAPTEGSPGVGKAPAAPGPAVEAQAAAELSDSLK
jgi:hypothetical protein